MYKLFYASESASMGVRVLLEEIGADYELLETSVEAGAPRPAAQLAINPNGWVPVLMWEDRAMYECVAITIFLGDCHPEAGLAPAVDAVERGVYLQTLVYFSSSVQNAFQLSYYPDRFADDPEGEPGAQRRGARRLRETLGVIDAQIGANRWVLGDKFTAVDIYLFMLTTWLQTDRGHPPLHTLPNVARISAAVQARPSVQLVYANWIAGLDG